MIALSLHCKVALLCYAILSFPYVTLALDSRAASPGGQYARTGDSGADSSVTTLRSATTDPNTVVNSSTVVSNVPRDQQDVIYIRNFTLVGKKSQGFNITQWELDTNYPDRSTMTTGQRLDAGDVTIKLVAAGTLFALATGVACIATIARCGKYIGKNIGEFWEAVGKSGGKAAVNATKAVAGAAPAALQQGVKKREYVLGEEFGCYSENGYSATCTNGDVASSAFTVVTEHDGSTNPPNWSCYEAYDSYSEEIYGYYSHCFANGGKCYLECGVGRPEIESPIYPITLPDS